MQNLLYATKADVAPFMGAWIETAEPVRCLYRTQRRSLHGSVD